jgi:hypothetical protein
MSILTSKYQYLLDVHTAYCARYTRLKRQEWSKELKLNVEHNTQNFLVVLLVTTYNLIRKVPKVRIMELRWNKGAALAWKWIWISNDI